MSDPEVLKTFYRHMQSILENDQETYHETVMEDLTLYEWWVTPHRLDGIPFHDFMMEANDKKGSVFGVEGDPEGSTRFDYANLKVQQYDRTAIVSYSLLISSTDKDGKVNVASHNESRILVKVVDDWKVVHVHKSPDWNAPHTPPTGRI